MLIVQKLSRPTKRSGYRLESGETKKMGGLTVVNSNKFAVYVDKYVSPNTKKAKAKVKRKQ